MHSHINFVSAFIFILVEYEGAKMKYYNNPNHPTIPEEYRHETNYKNIPKEYLSRDIPKGRGMIKWSPFATAPKQYEDLNNIISKQTYQTMPLLDELEVYDINTKLMHYAVSKELFNIVIFEDHSHMKYLVAIKKIIPHEKVVILTVGNTEKSINFGQIIAIESL